MIVCAWDLYVLVEPMNITRHTQVVRLYVLDTTACMSSLPHFRGLECVWGVPPWPR